MKMFDYLKTSYKEEYKDSFSFLYLRYWSEKDLSFKIPEAIHQTRIIKATYPFTNFPVHLVEHHKRAVTKLPKYFLASFNVD